MTQIDSRWYVTDNEIHGSFMDYVVIVKPSFLADELGEVSVFYNVIYCKGNYVSAPCISITCKTLEKVFESINKYSQYKMFDKVVEKIRSDYVDSAVLKMFGEFE